jgi:hypothetical protein
MKQYTRDQLERMAKVDLQCLCLRNHLSDRGNRWELIERLAPGKRQGCPGEARKTN